jgi:hypothetical protein
MMTSDSAPAVAPRAPADSLLVTSTEMTISSMMIGIDPDRDCSQGAVMRLPRCITEGLRLRSAAAKFNGFCVKPVQERAFGRARSWAFDSPLGSLGPETRHFSVGFGEICVQGPTGPGRGPALSEPKGDPKVPALSEPEGRVEG